MAAGPYDGRRRDDAGHGHRGGRGVPRAAARASPPSTRSSRCPTATWTPTPWSPPGWPTCSPAACPAPPRAPPRTRRAAPRRRPRRGPRRRAGGPGAGAGGRRGRRTARGRDPRATRSTSSRAPTSPGPAGGSLRARHARRAAGRGRAARWSSAGRRSPTATRAVGPGRDATAAARTAVDDAGRAARRARRRRRRWPRSSARPSRRRAAPGWPSSATSPSWPCSRLQAAAPAPSRPCSSRRPARSTPGPTGAGAMMADTAALPWLRPASRRRAGRRPRRADAGDLADPADAVRPRPGRAGRRRRRRRRPRRPRRRRRRRRRRPRCAATTPRSPGRRRPPGATDPEGFRAAAAGLRDAWTGLRGRVTLLAPADGTYSLASSDAPLVLTVQNDLPVRRGGAARTSSTRGSRGLIDRRHRRADAGARSADDAPGAHRGAAVRRVRGDRRADHARRAARWASRSQLQVKSTAYGSISLIITIGAGRPARPALPAPAGPLRAAPPPRPAAGPSALAVPPAEPGVTPPGEPPPTRSPV